MIILKRVERSPGCASGRALIRFAMSTSLMNSLCPSCANTRCTQIVPIAASIVESYQSSCLPILSESQRRALIIADNKLIENARCGGKHCSAGNSVGFKTQASTSLMTITDGHKRKPAWVSCLFELLQGGRRTPTAASHRVIQP